MKSRPIRDDEANEAVGVQTMEGTARCRNDVESVRSGKAMMGRGGEVGSEGDGLLDG